MEKIEELTEHLKEYIHNRLSAVKLKFAAQVSSLFASGITIVFLAAILFLFFLFAGIGLAEVICSVTGNNFAGYFAVAGVYLIAAFTIRSFKEKWIRIPILNKLIKELFNDEEDKKH